MSVTVVKVAVASALKSNIRPLGVFAANADRHRLASDMTERGCG